VTIHGEIDTRGFPALLEFACSGTPALLLRNWRLACRYMHVRFRQTKTRLQASLIQTRREGGRVRNEHVASLGTVDAPASVAGRLAFCKACMRGWRG
jgi:hypothetical protein